MQGLHESGENGGDCDNDNDGDDCDDDGNDCDDDGNDCNDSL